MKALWKFLTAFVKRIRDGPSHPILQEYCAHCGLPFARQEPKETKAEDVEIIEHATDDGRTEITRRDPGQWQVQITRHDTSKDKPASIVYLRFCEYCFWMKPKFIGIRLGENCSIHYIWENARGESYEIYEFGKELNE